MTNVVVSENISDYENADNLFNKGRQLVIEGEYERAYEYFEKCFGIEQGHKGASLELFFYYIKKEKFDEAFFYFTHFFEKSNPDLNLYLLLLNNIIDIPKEYQTYVENLNFSDIRLDYKDKNHEEVDLSNKVRGLIFNKKYRKANNCFIDIIKNKMFFQRSITVEEIIIKKLLNKVMKIDHDNSKNLLGLIKNKKYSDVIVFLENKKLRSGLNEAEKYVLILVQHILNIKRSNVIPEKSVNEINGMFDAIISCDFELALIFCNLDNKINGYNQNYNYFYFLLTDICGLIANVSKTSSECSTSLESNTSIILNHTLDNLFKSLLNKKNEEAIHILYLYLEMTGKSEYKNVMENLIKISLMEEDNTFLEPMVILSQMADGYEFNVSKYISFLKGAIKEENYSLAHLYLNIISDLNKLENTNLSVEELKESLYGIEMKLNSSGCFDVVQLILEK